LNCKNLIFSGHAVQRLFARGIAKSEIRALAEKGEIIREYPDDLPYPSKLILGFVDGRPIHLVVGYNESEQTCIVITVYEPNRDVWREDFKEKRTP